MVLKYVVYISLIDIFESVVYNTYQSSMSESDVGDGVDVDLYNLFYIDGEVIPFVHGMQIKCVVGVYNEDVYDEDTPSEILMFDTNNIPILYETYCDIIYGDDVDDEVLIYINKEEEEMDKIHIVNKTVTENIINNITGTSTSSYQLQPLFFRAVDLTSITLRKDITDRIAINLDIYKSKVDTFIFRVNNMYYPEIGRTPSGVVFAITGTDLADATTTGYYYICDSDYEVITSGKYTLE